VPIIRAEGISKCFPVYHQPSDYLWELLGFRRRRHDEPFWAVRDVTVEIERGDCLGIVGENGSGKSTLLGILAGVLRPSEGWVRLGGRVSALLELGTGFNPDFTGRENILMNAAILRLTDAQTRRRIPEIERFAEIGEFVDRPVKTYSSGMFLRLAFAVAVHLDPDILIVDEALSVGDYFFQQRCIQKILQMKQQGRTIVFVSHDLEAVRVLADRAIWMERGSVRLEGKTDEVVAKYLAAMVTRGHKDVMQEEPLGKPMAGVSDDLDISPEAFERIPPFLCSIPNVDHRYGNGKARIEGIGIFNAEGSPTATASQGDRLCIRISVQFLDDVERPNIGFMLRNRLGQDVTGTNVLFEGQRLKPARVGDRLSVDFVMDLPFLHSGFYYFSPAIADGELNQYDMCDWIDNACAVNVLERSTTYGHLRIPIRIRVIRAPCVYQHIGGQ
jgi:ABC-type polysaccharide/polyol phosphate transport system ATPase subunit